MKLVEVTWFDAQTSTESYYVDEIPELKPIMTKSVGYFVAEIHDQQIGDYIVLAFTSFETEIKILKHFQIIPKSIIKEIKELAVGGKQ